MVKTITRINPAITYGSFIDAMREVAKSVDHAEVLFQEWYNTASETEWNRYRGYLLTERLLLGFTEDMASAFQNLLRGTFGEELYSRRMNDGHTFLRAIHAKCIEVGIVIDLRIDVPLSASDAISMT